MCVFQVFSDIVGYILSGYVVLIRSILFCFKTVFTTFILVRISALSSSDLNSIIKEGNEDK